MESHTENTITKQVEQLPASQMEQKVDNFFIAHFKGDVSLGISYWVNNLVIAGFFIPLILVIWIVATADIIGLGSIIVAVLAGGISYGWAWVGLWRSSDKHQARGGKRFWAVAAKVVLILNIIGTLLQIILAI